MRGDWLGGLDSNQDSQIQNLESCQLDDLPVGKCRCAVVIASRRRRFLLQSVRVTGSDEVNCVLIAGYGDQQQCEYCIVE